MEQGALEICRPSQATTALADSDIIALEVCNLLKVYNPGKVWAVNWLISVITSSQHSINKPSYTSQPQGPQWWVPSENGLHTTCKAKLDIQGPCPPSTEDLCSGVASGHRSEDGKAKVMIATLPSPSLWLGSLPGVLKSQHVSPSLSLFFSSFFFFWEQVIEDQGIQKQLCIQSVPDPSWFNL